MAFIGYLACQNSRCSGWKQLSDWIVLIRVFKSWQACRSPLLDPQLAIVLAFGAIFKRSLIAALGNEFMTDLMLLLPPAMPLLDAGLLILASLVTSFITAAFGIGGGFTLIALLALLLPPAALIPVHGVVQLGSNGGRVAIMAKDVVWRPILPFVIGSVIGASIGGMVVVQLPPWAVQLALGIFIIWVVFAKLPPIRQRYVLIGGIISSFLTMFFGATGNFIAAMVKSMNLEPVPHVATHSLMMTFQHFIKVLIFGIIGFQFMPYLPLIIGMLISGFIGTVIGRNFLTRAGGLYFKRVLNMILFLAAFRLIWVGIEGLLAR